MPANTSVAKVAIDTRRGKTICCLRAPFLLVVALSGFLSGATYALRMINLDAPERVFLGDTIRLSCYYALQTASGFERAIQTSTRDLYSPSSSSTSSSSYPLVSGGGGGRWQKSNSIQESNYLTSEVFKSATSELTRIAPANEAFRRSTSGSALVNSKQVAANSELLVAASEQLYAVKWYKDDREFFRYLAQGSPKKQRLPMDGLMVDVSVLFWGIVIQPAASSFEMVNSPSSFPSYSINNHVRPCPGGSVRQSNGFLEECFAQDKRPVQVRCDGRRARFHDKINRTETPRLQLVSTISSFVVTCPF